MNPELLMIESDHDLRNPADFLVIDKVAKAIFRVPGIGRVQAITRPLGTLIEHTSIPFMIGMQGTTQQMNQKYMSDRMADMLVQADEMQNTIDTMEKMQRLTREMAATNVAHGLYQDQGDERRHRRVAGPHRRFRRLLPSAAQLPLLGTTLLQHPDLLVDALDLRHPRRHRHHDRRHPAARSRYGTPRRLDAADGGVDARDDRDHEDHEDHDADDVRQPEGSSGSDGRDAGQRQRHGEGVRRVARTTTCSISAGHSLRQPRLQTRRDDVPLPDGHAVRFIIFPARATR